MKFLSIDLEATGVEENDQMIEFAAVPIDIKNRVIEDALTFHCYLKCPSVDELKSTLHEWIIENMLEVIKKASEVGLSKEKFKNDFGDYLASEEIKKYFGEGKIRLFGKSLSALDLPLLRKTLGHDFMQCHFIHRTLDLTCVVYYLIEQGKLPPECESGAKLAKHLGPWEVAHTALEDAIMTAKAYFLCSEL